MTDSVKFRDNAFIAVTAAADRLTIHMREVGERRDADGNREQFTVRRLPDIVLPFSRLSPAVQDRARAYGLEVRLTRAAALGSDRKSGKPAPVQEKWEAVNRLAEFYKSGTEAWEMPSAGGSGLSADSRVLIEALVRGLSLSAETAEEQVRAMSPAERDALRVAPELKVHIDAIYAERAASAGEGKASELLERLRKAR